MSIPVLVLVTITAEITAIAVVAHYVGVLATLGLLIATTVLGGVLLRREGRRAMAAITEAFQLRRNPDREITDGVLLALAGLLITIPGFITDLAGLALLAPPTRALARRMLRRRTAGQPNNPLGFTRPAPNRPAERRQFSGEVVDGEVVRDS